MALTQVQDQMFSGSTNTTTAIQSNGTTAITIDASQNVGIGTASPSYKLDVNGQGAIRPTSGDSQMSVISAGANYATYQIANSTNRYSMQIRTDVSNAWVLRDETAGANRVFVDTSGNLGIGATPTAKFQVSGGDAYFYNTATYGGIRVGYDSSNYWDIKRENASTGRLAFFNGASEKMAIDTSGNLLVGTTDSGSGATAAKVRIIGSAANNLFVGSSSAGGWRITSDALNDGGTFYHIKFTENGTQRGSITSNGSATLYNTTSDYRLKENVQPMVGALDKVSALKPVTYDWSESKANGQGFIAHELQAVIPDAVVGKKDAIDLDGNPLYQQIDTSVLVATLTAALQELNAKVDAQAAEIAALKAK